ncbi:Yet3 protein [Saccharomycopsis crataegensis]|uniref:Endoplasmic reticulum transmembrane protein n=1 Tax=Saccharomycopsis crataegensis TaxID=43959 RepID=A0AAV5QHQ9_9ASCO|nr:Yet3 protein [Saccharomycopsis crataegensis]
MSLYYNLIFAILSAEIILFTIISLPLPSKLRAPLLNAISKPFQSVQVQVSIKSILIFILILFIDAFNKCYSIEQQLKEIPPGAPYVDRSEIQAKRFYAQRNLYLTGFTLFLTLITNRTYSLVGELIEVKKTVRGGALVDDKALVELKEELKAKNEEINSLKEKAKEFSEEYDKI